MIVNFAAEIGLLVLVLALITCITVLAAIGVQVPDVLAKTLLFLAGGGAGVTMPAIANRMLTALSVQEKSLSSPATSSAVAPGGPVPAPPA